MFIVKTMGHQRASSTAKNTRDVRLELEHLNYYSTGNKIIASNSPNAVGSPMLHKRYGTDQKGRQVDEE